MSIVCIAVGLLISPFIAALVILTIVLIIYAIFMIPASIIYFIIWAYNKIVEKIGKKK